MHTVTMPQLGLTMVEGKIGRWLKQVGDTIKKGDPLVEISTDKLNNEVEAPADGVLAKIVAQEGDVIPVKQPIAVLCAAGEKLEQIELPETTSSAAKAGSNPAPAGDSEQYDVVVIGGGPGGYVAAIRAAQLGGKVALVEKTAVGGTCLNRGCIPTKALVRSCEVLRDAKNSASYGIQTENIGFDFTAMMSRKQQVVEQLVKGVTGLLKANKIANIAGKAALADAHTVAVQLTDGGSKTLSAKTIILATGSESAVIPIPGADLPRVLTSEGALSLTQVPKSIVIMGAGAIGVEFAAIFNTLGVEVTIVEMMDQVTPIEDADVARYLSLQLKRQGVKVHLKTKVSSIQDQGALYAVNLETPKGTETVNAEYVLMAVGRAPNTADIGLEQLEIKKNGRFIAVNDHMCTNVANIYAIGDVVGAPLLAHVASAEGMIAAENAMGQDSTIDYRVIPGCTWSLPEIASVGLTEQKAKEQGYQVKTGRFQLAASGKALASGHTEGFIKVVADAKFGEVLGVHMIGHGVTDLIGEAVLAIKMEATLDELAQTIHPHPTLTETLMEAALGALGRGVHSH